MLDELKLELESRQLAGIEYNKELIEKLDKVLTNQIENDI